MWTSVDQPNVYRDTYEENKPLKEFGFTNDQVI